MSLGYKLYHNFFQLSMVLTLHNLNLVFYLLKIFLNYLNNWPSIKLSNQNDLSHRIETKKVPIVIVYLVIGRVKWKYVIYILHS